jgi:S-DNA-T family DNA segregation ATPase FtsK/SpoIIIE
VSTIVVRRPQRRPAPDLPSGEIVLEAPPEIPRTGGRQWQQSLMALPMMAGSGATALLFTGGTSGPLRGIVGGLFGMSALSMVGMGLMSGGGAGRAEMSYARRQYLRQLSQHRVRVVRAADQQRTALAYLHPDPGQLWTLVGSYRLWERRREDADFGVARIGRGSQSLATTLVPPATKSLEALEPLSSVALRRFITTYTALPDLPAAMAVNGFARVYLTGEPHRARALARALVAQLAVFHAPDDLLIAVCTPTQLYDEWEWTKWLPHALHPEKTDAVGQVRLFAPNAISLEAILEDLLGERPRFDPSGTSRFAGPHIVVVLDHGDVVGSNHFMTEGGIEGVTLLDLSTPPPRLLDISDVIFDIDEAGTLTSETIDDEIEVGRADELSVAESEALARQLAPLRLSASGPGEQAMTTELGLADLLDIGDPYSFDPAQTWIPRPNRDRLRVRFGVRPDGTPIELDLKESAQDGMGPHGLLIGATGSGKSELLRTLVLGLAITHPSNSLNFVLIDFKGGATFASLDVLPHTSAMITNLADELPLVDRMTDALNGELLRRQELLRAAGHYASLRDYERARQAGAPLEEVPTLFVVCDEFSELLSAKPDFIDMFVQIGRLGRSLGVHLLLASQRLEEGRLRGLDTHLSYRIGLRTFSSSESRVVLGSADAYELPKAPGHGYLKSGIDPMARFRAAYVSGVYRRAAGQAAHSGEQALAMLNEYPPTYLAPAEPDEPQPEQVADDDAVGESLMDILVDRLRGRGKPAHRVWLPPLRDPVTLDRLLPDLAPHPMRGLTTADASQHGALRAVIGIVDRPVEQRHDPLTLDLAGAAGHVAIVGGPQSGKSTALRSIMASLALTHTPAEVQFYCLDFGGGTLASMRDLPHTGWVATRQDAGAVRRTVAEVRQLMAHRERQFAESGVESMIMYRRMRRDGRHSGDPFGDVFLFIDGWQTVRNDFEDLEDAMIDMAARGLSYGIHVVVTAARWFDLRASIRDMFGTRIELRLGDPTDSNIDRKAALNVPATEPGRGITETKHQMLIALPRIDGSPTPDDLIDGVAHFVHAISANWTGAAAPPVRMLPATVSLDSLPGGSIEHGLPVGLAEHDLGAVRLDFSTEPNFVLFGESESGKTGFLRLLIQRITEAYTPDEARIILVDHRRSLLDAVPPEYLVGYGTSLNVTEELMNDAAGAMEPRLPGPDVTAEQLRNRSWWSGMDLFVLVDDYDLLTTGGGDPLTPLIPYLPQARDIGLHVVVARRTGGAGRALYLPLLTALREAGSPGLVMSGDKDEGALLGNVKPQSLPPGRGWLVDRRGGAQLIQLAWLPPRE